MKSIYMSVNITNYNLPYIKPICTYCEQVDDGEIVSRKLSLEEAQWLMWELVLAGGERSFSPNMYDNTISNVSACLWTRH